MIEQKMNDIKIKYEGEENQINANTFINSLLHLSTVIQEINRELHPDRKIELKINALTPGSFVVDIHLQMSILDEIGKLFTKENLSIAAEIAGVLGGIISIRQLLQKEKPAIINNTETHTTIINNNGDKITIENKVYKIYTTNDTINNALSSEFDVLSGDNNIEGLTLFDSKNEVLCSVNKSEFYPLSEGVFEEETQQNKIVPRTVTLIILRLSFERNMKWEFYYDGNKISAKMDDETFYSRIDDGETFAKGDCLEAEIEISQQFDITVNTYINKSYRIKRILNHVPRGVQGKMDL